MITVRPFQKHDWFEFLEIIEKSLQEKASSEQCFALIDELYMRKVDSISEGASYKLKSPAKNLLNYFQARQAEDTNFSSEKQLEEFCKQAHYILDLRIPCP